MQALKEAAEGELKGILAYSEVPLVSCDYNGTTFLLQLMRFQQWF